MVKVGISTSAGKASHWIDWVVGTDVEAVEINLMTSGFPLVPQYVTDYASRLNSYDVSVHSRSDGFSDDLPYGPFQRERLLVELDIARDLGANELVVHPPWFHGMDKLKRNASKVLKQAIERARAYGVELLFENTNKGPFKDPEKLLELFRAFPEAYMCLDVGHMHVSQQSTEKEMKMIDALKERIVYLHVHDNDGSRDQHLELGTCNGTGVRYEKLLRYIQKRCNLKKAISEVHEISGTKRTAKKLERILR